MSSSQSLDQITTLYRQNVSKFLFVSDVSLTRQSSSTTNNPQHTNNKNSNKNTNNNQNSSTMSWMGDAARSLALRAATATPFFDAKHHHHHHHHDANDDQKSKNIGHTSSQQNNNKMNYRSTTMTKDDDIRKTTTLLQQSSMNSWSDCICMACGTLLLPPPPSPSLETDETNYSSTTNPTPPPPPPSLLPVSSHICLRPLKRGKTRRRRASRVKAKEFHNRTLSLQRRGGGGGNINSTTSSIQIRNETIQKEQMQRMASMYNLGDGRAKNCLVIKCTFCGMEKRRKGVEIKKSIPPQLSSTKNRVQRSRGSGSNHIMDAKHCSSQKPNKDGRKLAEPKGESMNVSTQIHNNADFISLTMGGGNNARKRKEGGGGGDVDDSNKIISPLLSLQGGKKKKKKKPEMAKKSDLMDFLSSLND